MRVLGVGVLSLHMPWKFSFGGKADDKMLHVISCGLGL